MFESRPPHATDKREEPLILQFFAALQDSAVQAENILSAWMKRVFAERLRLQRLNNDPDRPAYRMRLLDEVQDAFKQQPTWKLAHTITFPKSNNVQKFEQQLEGMLEHAVSWVACRALEDNGVPSFITALSCSLKEQDGFVQVTFWIHFLLEKN